MSLDAFTHVDESYSKSKHSFIASWLVVFLDLVVAYIHLLFKCEFQNDTD